MKAIIGEKLYDTEKATEICKFRRGVKGPACWWNPDYSFTVKHDLTMYRTSKGAYFEHDTDKDTINFLLETEARAIIKQLFPDLYIELFGTVEEG